MAKSIVDDIKRLDGSWLKSLTIDGVQYTTKSYQLWKNMKSRCIDGGTVQSKFPTYAGREVTGSFLDFDLFTEWYTKQVGYNSPDMHLDKDLICEGNRCYNEDTCVLIPKGLNLFLVSQDKNRGSCVLGVSLRKTTGKFRATIRIDGRSVNLGEFVNEEEAYVAYKAAKESEARRWLARLLLGEYVVDNRVIERLKVWTVSP